MMLPVLNMDLLYESVAEKGNVCVGLDTAPEYVPVKERKRHNTDADAVLAYNLALIEATIDVAACFKLQIAYYEAMGIAGLETYSATLKYLRKRGALVIADIKRGDIADTASRYAQAHFSGEFEADFVTLTPFLGMDSIEPWLKHAEADGKGAFVLMRTSNKGRKDFQELELKDNSKMYNVIGKKLSELAGKSINRKHGYGAFGAVVGADPQSPDEREEILAIRNAYNNLFFLIPGYGAQGGAAEDAALLLRDGNGGVVNASRSILRAWITAAEKNGLGKDEVDLAFASEAAREAAINMRDAIKAAASK